MIDTFVVFGASGDLAGRFLLPAAASLLASGALGSDFRFIGVGPQAWSDAEFVEHTRGRLAAHAPAIDHDGLIAALHYRQADVTDAEQVGAALALATESQVSGPLAVYLALPTHLMLGAVQALHAHGLPPGSRLAVEKPFGSDLQSALALNAALAGFTEPGSTYRVDHALATSAVQQLPQARVPANNQPIRWHCADIEQIELLWEETLALEGRAAFYDRAGALRDVMQNHLVQVLCAIAQPEPQDLVDPDSSTPSERRAAVLRTVRPLTEAQIRTSTRRARYAAGRLADDGAAHGRTVPDYIAEDGVDPARNTETFAEVELVLDSSQWAGTRFVMRAGKALSRRRRGVLVQLRAGGIADSPVWLDLDVSSSGAPRAEPDAYEQIIADLLGGGTEFSVSAAEVELAWQLFDPVLGAWAAGEVPMQTYQAGSDGP